MKLSKQVNRVTIFVFYTFKYFHLKTWYVFLFLKSSMCEEISLIKLIHRYFVFCKMTTLEYKDDLQNVLKLTLSFEIWYLWNPYLYREENKKILFEVVMSESFTTSLSHQFRSPQNNAGSRMVNQIIIKYPFPISWNLWWVGECFRNWRQRVKFMENDKNRKTDHGIPCRQIISIIGAIKEAKLWILF